MLWVSVYSSMCVMCILYVVWLMRVCVCVHVSFLSHRYRGTAHNNSRRHCSLHRASNSMRNGLGPKISYSLIQIIHLSTTQPAIKHAWPNKLTAVSNGILSLCLTGHWSVFSSCSKKKATQDTFQRDNVFRVMTTLIHSQSIRPYFLIQFVNNLIRKTPNKPKPNQTTRKCVYGQRVYEKQLKRNASNIIESIEWSAHNFLVNAKVNGDWDQNQQK